MTFRWRSVATTLLMALASWPTAWAQRAEAVAFPPLGRSDIAEAVGVLYLPPGLGPHPVMVLLHGCGGVRDNSQQWAADLVAQGVAALVTDHFGPRRIDEICTRFRGRMVEQRERRRDTYGALMYLAARPDIDAERIGVMGFSNGGLATVNALVPGLSDPPAPRFRVGIALYPDCSGYIGLALSAPLLILIGTADDWTPAAVCRSLSARLPGGSAAVDLVELPGALHSFDEISQGFLYLSGVYNTHSRGERGATIGYSPRAHEAARERVRAFMREHLRAPR